MNQVLLIGRLTKDPDVRYTQSQTAVARFSVAINRGKDKDGKDLGADYPNVVCFGKTAELVEKYLGKGRLVGITGKITTGSYEKDGKKYYTTDITASHIEFLDKAVENSDKNNKPVENSKDEVPAGISQMTDEEWDALIPF